MAASYPGAIKTFSAITLGATVLEQALFDEMALEIEAIETTLGLNAHGSSGSIKERVNLAMDYDGGPPGFVRHVSPVAKGRRMRCGVESVTGDQLTNKTTGGTFTVTLATPFPANHGMLVFPELQLTESDPADSTIAAFICHWQRSNTNNTSFTVLVSTRVGTMPAVGSSFMFHWIAIENDDYSMTQI